MEKEKVKTLCMNGPSYTDGMTPEQIHQELLDMIARMPQDEPKQEVRSGTPAA